MPEAHRPGPIYTSNGDGHTERSGEPRYPVPFQPPGSMYRPEGDRRMEVPEGLRIPVPQTDYEHDNPECKQDLPPNSSCQNTYLVANSRVKSTKTPHSAADSVV